MGGELVLKIERHTWEQPGQVFPFSQVRCLVWTPPPQSALHLLHEPQEDQKMGTGQGLFSLQKLKGERTVKIRNPNKLVPLDRGPAFWASAHYMVLYIIR